MKKTLITILVLLVLAIGAYFVLNTIAHRKIEQFLNEQVDQGNLQYKNFSLSLLRGNVTLNQISYQKGHQAVDAGQVRLKGFSYWRYLVHNEIYVRQLLVDRPNVSISKRPDTEKEQEKTSLDKEIKVKRLTVEKGSITYAKDTSQILKVSEYDLEIHNITVNRETLQKKIPATYTEFSLELSDLWYDLNELQELKAGRMQITDNTMEINTIELLPKYTRKNYVQVIPYEKDLMSLKLDSLSVPQYQLQLNRDLPLFEAPEIVLRGIDFDIYRDKTVTDDLREKPLYSKMLRDLNIDLDIDSILLKNANINYQELIKKDRDPGEVYFSQLNASIKNVTNINPDRKDFPVTQIDIESRFMGKSPLSVHWEFRVNDPEDVFRISGKGFDISQQSINSFFIPAFNVKTEGTVDEVYFNYEGNNNVANGDFQIDHENFTVEVLKKDGKEKSGFLSWVANIFVKKGDKGEQVAEHVKEVERDKTKSFWNYFWSCIEAGLAKTIL
ncbi:hypothetical protein [Sinomicrobium sp. M5D2P17]